MPDFCISCLANVMFGGPAGLWNGQSAGRERTPLGGAVDDGPGRRQVPRRGVGGGRGRAGRREDVDDGRGGGDEVYGDLSGGVVGGDPGDRLGLVVGEGGAALDVGTDE